MLNLFSIKKWVALLIPCLVSGVGFSVGAVFYGLLWGTIIFLVLMAVSVVLSNLLLKNPFTDLLEGKGVLVIDISSTGIVSPFICRISEPFILNEKRKVKDIFDRQAVYNLTLPVVAKDAVTKTANGGISFDLSNEEFNRSRFSLFHYPVLFYNSQIKSLLTKDFLSEQEKIAFAEHSIIYQNRLIENLNTDVRDFARYIVEMLRPAKNVFASKWIWIIVIVAFVILGFMFAPAIIGAVKNTIPTATTAVTGGTGNAVTIR